MNIHKHHTIMGFLKSIYPKLIMLVIFALGSDYKAAFFSLDIIGTLN